MTSLTTTPPATPKQPDDIRLAELRLLGLTPPAASAAPIGVLQRLRTICPRRSLNWNDAERIAERQATVLRSALGFAERPKLPTAKLSELAFVTVTYRDGFPTSGMATKTGLGWVILLRGDEPNVRQRFSLAHEIKHVIDDDLMHALPDGLYRATQLYSAAERAERVADRFAAALLMPKALLRRDWTDGLQEIAVLARRYEVSRSAMEVRLRQLGLLEATPRCAPLTADSARSH